MKPLFNNWREYLKESILREFKKADEESVMEDEDSFTVAYEIELVSDDYIGDLEGGGGDLYSDEYEEEMARQRARHASEYLNFDYFDESVRERDTGELWNSMFGDWDDPPLEDFLEKYMEDETPYGPNYLDEFIFIAGAESRHDGGEEEQFEQVLKKVLTPGSTAHTIFIKTLMSNPKIKGDLEDKGLVPYIDKQGVLPGMGSSEDTLLLFENNEEAVGAFRDYIYDFEEGDVPRKAGIGMSIPLNHFLEALGEGELAEEFAFDAGQTYESMINLSRYTTLNDLTEAVSIAGIKSPFFKRLGTWLEKAAEEYIENTSQENWDEYRDTPEAYLDDMGYEWEDQFNEWWENNWEYHVEGSGIQGGDAHENVDRLLNEYLPNFWGKWGSSLATEPDASLPRNHNVELVNSNPIYMDGLDEAFEFLEDFFNDFDAQDNFKFTEKTGLHTNIGYLRTDPDGEKRRMNDYNVLKGLLFLNHDFALKNFEERKGSSWAGDLKADAVKHIQDLFQKEKVGTDKRLTQTWLSRNFDLFEKTINDVVLEYSKNMYSKGIGFNINYVKSRGYIEFRYPGNEVTYEKMKDATLYYAHIVKVTADDDYKKEEYMKKLVSFVENAKSSEKTEVADFPETKELIKKYKNIPLQRYKTGTSRSAFWHAMRGMSEEEKDYLYNINLLGYPSNMMDSHYFSWFDDIKKGKTVDDTKVLVKTLGYDGDKVVPFTLEYDIKDFERDLRNGVLSPVLDNQVKTLATYIYDKVVKEGETKNNKESEDALQEGTIHYSKVEQAVLEAINKKIFNI